MTALFIVLGIAAAVFVFIYNGMIAGRNAVRASFGDIDVELKRRFDLIPNLVETAKKYMSHEQTTLTAVTAARNDAAAALKALSTDPLDKASISKMGEAEAKLSQMLYSFKAVAESYPQLKADQTMMSLMEELTNTENRIAFIRQNYNDTVMRYNTSLETFPNVIFARQFKFEPATTWTIQNEQEREVVRVSF